jgi:hypothetical protein
MNSRILPPSMAVAATQAAAQLAAAASPSESKTLPTLQLSVAEYGLGVPSIVVYAAAEPKRLQVTGAALAVGAAPSPGEDQAAKSFFEDLLRRGRLKVPKAAKSAAEVVRAAAPATTNCDGKEDIWCCAGFVSTAASLTIENGHLAPV